MSLPAAGTQETPAREPQQKFKGDTSLVWGVIHLPGGQRIITCSHDGSLRLWNLESGLQIGMGWSDGKSPVFTIALSPDGRTVASGSADGAVRLWNVETGKVIAKWTGHSNCVWCVYWSRDGQRVVSGSADGTARVWDMESGKNILGPINTGHEEVYAAVYSPDETLIATGGHNEFTEDKLVKIWDGKTFELVTTLKGDAWCMAWTADRRRLISGLSDGSIVTWNTTTWKQLAVFTGHKDAIIAISISPDDRILASASYDRTARLWNIENGRPISSPLHAPEVHCISFSADGKLLATGCNDNACTWDVSAIVKEAGIYDVLSDSNDPARKSALDSDATRSFLKPLNNTPKLPQGFLDDTGIHSSSTQPPPRTLHDRLSLLFHSHPAIHEATSHSTPTPFRPLNSTLARFSRHHPSDNVRRPPAVEVPYTRGQLRNVSKATRKSKEKVSDPSNIMTLSIHAPSRPPNSGATQQSSGDASGQNSSSQSQLAVNTVPAAPAAATTTPAAETLLCPEHAYDIVVIRQAGCWTRFWLFLCCISTENHH